MAVGLLLKRANANADDGDPATGRHWWLALGLVIGLGMMTRYTMLFCAAGIVVALLATPLRRQLAGPWPWLGVLVSPLVFAPNAWWQWQHDFIYLDFLRHIPSRYLCIGSTAGFLGVQLLARAIGKAP